MNRFIRVIPIAASLLASSVVQAGAQEVHEIRMVGSAKGEFRFEPASVKARRGDVLLFRAVERRTAQRGVPKQGYVARGSGAAERSDATSRR